MADQELTRLSRLIAIITQLQTGRLVTATAIAEKFQVSVRTIYRDIRTLESAGIPIGVEEGKGYSLMEGFRIPPVMFTETEANALITAGQLVLQNKDASLISSYTGAIDKIKSLLRPSAKEKAAFLSERIVFRQNPGKEITSHFLSALQSALVDFNLVRMNYQAAETEIVTVRVIEPFALYSANENWILIGWCRLREDYRSFRLDRILKVEPLAEKFTPHSLSLSDYFEICRKKNVAHP